MARVDTSLVMRGAPILANSRMNRSHPSIPVEQIGDKNTYLFSGSDPCAARTYDDRRSAIASFHGRGQHTRCVTDWRISTCASDYAVGPAKQLPNALASEEPRRAILDRATRSLQRRRSMLPNFRSLMYFDAHVAASLVPSPKIPFAAS